MAIVNFVNYSSRSKSSQSRGCMRSVMKYVSRDDKTLWHDRHLVTGVNCQAASAYDDFLNTKLLYHKDGGRMLYHLVQCFPSGAEVDPDKAHAAALKLAEQFKDHEVLVCTHTDRDHVHSHLIINSVNFETGRKLHVDGDVIDRLKMVNDQICAELGLPVFEPLRERKEKPMPSREYRVAEKRNSWKYRLINAIDDCMTYARSKEEFIKLMGEYRITPTDKCGIGIRWEDARKNITYALPSGMRCRDDRLHEEKYLKENMEHEFAIRQEALQRGAEGPEQAKPDGDAFAPQWSAPTAVKNRRNAHDADDRRGREEDTKPGSQSEQLHTSSAKTGWESKRELFYEHRKHGESFEEVRSQLNAYRENLNNTDRDSILTLDPVADALISTAVTLDALSNTGTVRDATTIRQHIDSKAYCERQRKRIAMGHKPDDHEDEKPAWSQTMM